VPQLPRAGCGYGFSLLFEMNTLFERYVGLTLKDALRNSGVEVILQGPRSHALLDVGTGKGRFMTKPDIVLRVQGQPKMIIDTKWKRLNRAIDDPVSCNERKCSARSGASASGQVLTHTVQQMQLSYAHFQHRRICHSLPSLAWSYTTFCDGGT
jgi:hypothetical protein